MTMLATPVLWCLLQVTLISLLGFILSTSMARRHPGSAASLAASAGIIILVATAFVAIPLPTLHLDWLQPPVADSQRSQQDFGKPSEQPTADERSAGSSATHFLDVRLMLEKIRGVTTAKVPPRVAIWSMRILPSVFMIAAVIGALRFLAGVRLVLDVTINSQPIKDQKALDMLCDLRAKMFFRHQVTMFESSSLHSATAIGVWRPMVVLPTGWREWTTDELRAVLAHELAHVVRRDFLWRLIIAVANVIHFYHPCVHLLFRRLSLMQELAADRLAVAAVADRGVYLRALSQLALRQDDRLTLRSEPAILPVFSGFLIRRIEMLRSKDGLKEMSAPRVLHASLLGLLVSAGAVAIAMRSVAQEPPEPPAVRVARRSSDAEKRSTSLFQRPPLDLSEWNDNENGMVVFRVGELLKNEAFKVAAEQFGRNISGQWQAWFSSDVPPQFHFDSIDYIAAEPTLAIRPTPPPLDGQRPNQLMFGTARAVVRFRQAVEWQQWIEKFIPEAKKQQLGDRVYYKLPVMPAMGPTHMFVTAINDRSICFFTDEQRMEKLVGGEAQPVTSRWSKDWQRFDGGIFTAVATDRDFNLVEPDRTDDESVSFHKLFTNAERFAIAWDLSPSFDRCALRIQIGCADRQSAEQVHAAIESTLVQADIEAILAKEKEVRQDLFEESPSVISQGAIEMNRFVISLLSSLAVQIVENTDSSVDVIVTSSAPFKTQAYAKALSVLFADEKAD